MSRLIVNADDFGLTPGINRAIAELHAAGAVTSATLMARAPATADAVEIARATPTLGIGCHILLVDGTPVLSPDRIPSLIDSRTGQFRTTLSAFLPRLLTGKINPSEIEAEAAAQIALLQDSGLDLTHIDTHKHTHMFPAVLRAVLRAARAAGIKKIRNPFEPAWAVRATARASLIRIAELTFLRRLRSTCLRLISEAGFTTTDGTIAMAATGVLDKATLTALIGRIAPGTWELVTHPGYNDRDLDRVRTRLRAERDREREALGALCPAPGIELVSFGGL
ncbi:MAG TPA: ChbG/HpnK family deacetylase [Terracidiphilus sp.]|nr:ChbG/HpnK family deacetylase [Terracidiphilus sp.]